MTRVAVLGASGWIGSALIEHLSSNHAAIEIIAPTRSEITGLTPVLLRELLSPDRTLSVVNAVGVFRGVEQDLVEGNLTFVERLVEALRETEAHLVQIGSAAEYGDPGSAAPVTESSVPMPLTLYGRTKYAATHLVRERGDWVVLRPFNCVDYQMPTRNPLWDIRDKVKAARKRNSEVELWSAETTRDHVSRAFLVRSLTQAALDRSVGTFNICSGAALTYGEIAEAMAVVSGGELPIRDLRRKDGIPAVVGDPTAWTEETGLSEKLTARQVADLVMLG